MFQMRPAAREEPRDDDTTLGPRHRLHNVATLPLIRVGMATGREGADREGGRTGESLSLQDTGARGRADGGGEGREGDEGKLPDV